MTASDTRVVDLMDTLRDTVHHEMDSMIRDHHIYKLMICIASNMRKPHPREEACWPIHTMNLQYVAVIKDFQIVGHTLLEIYLHITRSHITWYYIT